MRLQDLIKTADSEREAIRGSVLITAALLDIADAIREHGRVMADVSANYRKLSEETDEYNRKIDECNEKIDRENEDLDDQDDRGRC